MVSVSLLDVPLPSLGGDMQRHAAQLRELMAGVQATLGKIQHAGGKDRDC